MLPTRYWVSLPKKAKKTQVLPLTLSKEPIPQVQKEVITQFVLCEDGTQQLIKFEVPNTPILKSASYTK